MKSKLFAVAVFVLSFLSSFVGFSHAGLLLYSTYLGGSGWDIGQGIAVDTAGNAYIIGYTNAGNFPTTAGAIDSTFNGLFMGLSDVFVSKLNPSGTALVYSTYLGGSDEDDGNGIAVDAAGNAYITGLTYSSNFPTTLGAFDTSFNGGTDGFVSELNPSGTALVYSTYLGGNYTDAGYGIALDTAGNAYITGLTTSTDFPTTLGAFMTTPGAGWYAFVSKLNPTGTDLVYSTYLGGSVWNEGNAIAVDTAGNAYITGYTTSTDFPTTTGAFDSTANGSYDAFVSKINTLGTGSTSLVYSTYLGGNGVDIGNGIAVDTAGNAYITGFSASTDFPVTHAVIGHSFHGNPTYYDAFVSKLDSSGTFLVYSTYLGGTGDDYGYGISVDAGGIAYITGYTASTDFPTITGAWKTRLSGLDDVFVSKVNPIATRLLYSTYFGGSDYDMGYGIAVDDAGNIYITGKTESFADFPTTPGTLSMGAGGWDAFVSKISPATAVENKLWMLYQ